MRYSLLCLPIKVIPLVRAEHLLADHRMLCVKRKFVPRWIKLEIPKYSVHLIEMAHPGQHQMR